MSLPILSLLNARVLGVLVEKQHTVPDSYPLTLNALSAGCNQKTSRDPILEATEAEVQAAVDHLRNFNLVMETSGGRVMRYSQNIARVLEIPTPSVALLAVLMLRGPQTVSELRIRCERLHGFADTSSVEAFLQELAQRPAGALVIELPRQPGTRETRWSHLLCGVPAHSNAQLTEQGSAAPAEVAALSEIAALRASVEQLRAEVAELRAVVARLCQELGVPGR